MKPKYIATILSILFVLLSAWLAGFDFDTRGFIAVYIFAKSIGVGFFTYHYPGWDN